MELTREEIMTSINGRKTYVSYTPYIRINGFRQCLNLFTTVDFTGNEIVKQIKTDEAVAYAEMLSEEFSQYTNTSMLIEIGLSLLIDSKYRTVKDKSVDSIEKGDIIPYIFPITFTFPSCCGQEFLGDENLIHRTRTFLVDLDDFALKLSRKNWDINFGCDTKLNAAEIRESIIENGVSATPTLIAHKERLKQYNCKPKTKF